MTQSMPMTLRVPLTHPIPITIQSDYSSYGCKVLDRSKQLTPIHMSMIGNGIFLMEFPHLLWYVRKMSEGRICGSGIFLHFQEWRRRIPSEKRQHEKSRLHRVLMRNRQWLAHFAQEICKEQLQGENLGKNLRKPPYFSPIQSWVMKRTGWWKVKVTQSCLTLCYTMDCSSPGSSVHGILQARILEWLAISFSRGFSWSRDWTWVSCIAGRFFTVWVMGYEENRMTLQ